MRVLYVQYANPGAYPPLARSAHLLAESGAEVLLLGIGGADADVLAVPPAPGISVRLARPAEEGWRLKAHYARYAAWVTREALRWRPDWIYASDVWSAPIVTGLASLTGARIVYHEHDAPSQHHDSRAIRWCLNARQRLLRRADILITPNAERSARLSALAGHRPVFTVWNCPRRPARLRGVPSRSDSLRVRFRGSINADRLPLATIDALARLPSTVSLEIAGYETIGSRGYVQALMAHADLLGVSDRLTILGPVPVPDFALATGDCHVGLALMPALSMDENMQHMTGASNKVFEYLHEGAAPLVSNLPDWQSTFVDPGYAFGCDPRRGESIANALAWALDNPLAIRTMVDRGQQRLMADWNYESQFAPVLRAMLGESTLESRTSMDVEAECAS